MSSPLINNNSNVREGISRLARTYSRATSVDARNTTDNNQSSTWIDSFTRLDNVFSSNLLQLPVRLIDISLLVFGLYHSENKCELTHRFCLISILVLIFNVIDVVVVIFFLLCHSSRSAGEETSRGFRFVRFLCKFCQWLKFVTICVGTSYTFTSTKSTNTDCELVRFCLGIVCFSTWMLIPMPIVKPSMPARQSLLFQGVSFLKATIMIGLYLGTVTPAMIKTQDTNCTSTNSKDWYFDSPLKSLAYVGVILCGCTSFVNVSYHILNQLFFRLVRWQRFILRSLAFVFVLGYLVLLVNIYYYSVSAVLLFQPRSGGTCRLVAPDLYKVLLIWQWINIFTWLVGLAVSLILCIIFYCCGSLLLACLPAFISVPLLESIRGRLPTAPVAVNPDPPARQESIDALPIISFGEESDQFNQAECTICQTDFQQNEQVRRLQCGHLFHPDCVANWLLITRICPVCRQRMTMVDV